MTLIAIVLMLAVAGVAIWLVNTIVPMPAWMKTVINAVAAIFVLLWILQAFGLTGPVVRLR